MPVRPRLAPLLAALALLAAGCGGSDDRGGATTDAQAERATYVQQLGRAQETLDRTFRRIGARIRRGASAQEIGRSLSASAEALDDAAERFEEIDAPRDAQAAHAQLVAGLRELADEFSRSAADVRKGEIEAVADRLRRLPRSSGARKVDRATQRLARSGYARTG